MQAALGLFVQAVVVGFEVLDERGAVLVAFFGLAQGMVALKALRNEGVQVLRPLDRAADWAAELLRA